MRSIIDGGRVVQLAKEGKSFADIVRLTRFSNNFVHRWMHRDSYDAKVRKRTGKVTADVKRRIKKLAEVGVSSANDMLTDIELTS